MDEGELEQFITNQRRGKMEKAKLRKLVRILVIISIIFVSLYFLFHMYISYKLTREVEKPATIGIIGGADGPTAIYLGRQSSSYIVSFIFILLIIAGVIYLYFTKKQ